MLQNASAARACEANVPLTTCDEQRRTASTQHRRMVFNTQPPTMNAALPYRLCRNSRRVRWWLVLLGKLCITPLPMRL